MKPHQNRHHLTQGQAAGTMSLAGTDWQQGLPSFQQVTAKIINGAKDRYNIQAELRWEWVGRSTVDSLYYIPQEFCSFLTSNSRYQQRNRSG
jgi:hypothetical protein